MTTNALTTRTEEIYRENRLRRRAVCLGLALKKIPAKLLHANNLNGYIIFDERRGFSQAGSRWCLTLDDVEKYLNKEAEKKKA